MKKLIIILAVMILASCACIPTPENDFVRYRPAENFFETGEVVPVKFETAKWGPIQLVREEGTIINWSNGGSDWSDKFQTSHPSEINFSGFKIP